MYVLCAADKAYRRHTKAATVHHTLCALDKTWVVRKAEVVVGTEVEYFLTLYFNGCALWAFDDALFFVEAGLL